MKALVVYESMYSYTRQVAEAIAEGLGAAALPVAAATADRLADVDLVVIGAPTHVHGMSRPTTRQAAADAAGKPDSALHVERDATSSGVREWLAEHAGKVRLAAAFDTRVDMPAIVSGQASLHIARALRRRNATLAARPESFLVTKQNCLLAGEQDRARRWGRDLAGRGAAQLA